MVIAWRQVQTVRRAVENLPVEEIYESTCASRGVGPLVDVQEDAFSEHPGHLFGSTSEAYSPFHNKALTLLWSLVPFILSTKFPYYLSARRKRITARTSQMAGAAMIAPILHQ
jgi:hypothetical protein